MLVVYAHTACGVRPDHAICIEHAIAFVKLVQRQRPALYFYLPLQALGLNDLWLQLGRQIVSTVRDYPQRFTLLWQPHGMIVPGGRFLGEAMTAA